MPITVICPVCGKAASLKDEHAGRKYNCKSCNELIAVPKSTDAAREMREAIAQIPAKSDEDSELRIDPWSFGIGSLVLAIIGLGFCYTAIIPGGMGWVWLLFALPTLAMSCIGLLVSFRAGGTGLGLSIAACFLTLAVIVAGLYIKITFSPTNPSKSSVPFQ